MELNYVLLLRLEQISLRKVAIMLWNRIDILAGFDPRYPYSINMLTELLENWLILLKKVSESVLPELILNKITPLFKPIGLEIIRWLYFHAEFLSYPHTQYERVSSDDLCARFGRNILENLLWTSVGTVNYQKTAQELIRREILDVLLLYKLACFYCFDGYIPVLWEKLPGTIKDHFYDEWNNCQVAQPHLRAFWSNIIMDDWDIFVDEGTLENMANFYQYAFEMSSCIGNKSAAEYFYGKLTDAQREELLLKTAKAVATKSFSPSLKSLDKLMGVKYSNVLFYLLSQMIPEQQREVLEAHPYKILNCFLAWPWHDLFMDVAGLMWDFLPVAYYHSFLQELHASSTISESIKEKLFSEFFRRSPQKFKNSFIDKECFDGKFLHQLFKTEDSEIIRCILENIDTTAKARLVFCDQGLKTFLFLIQNEKWPLIKLFLEEAKLSAEDGERLNEVLKPYILACNIEQESLTRIILAWEQIFHSQI